MDENAYIDPNGDDTRHYSKKDCKSFKQRCAKLVPFPNDKIRCLWYHMACPVRYDLNGDYVDGYNRRDCANWDDRCNMENIADNDLERCSWYAQVCPIPRVKPITKSTQKKKSQTIPILIMVFVAFVCVLFVVNLGNKPT